MQYRIKQISEKLGIPPSTIRFWEKEFSNFVKPKRSNGGQRRYSRQDLYYLSEIMTLVYERKMSIPEARDFLELSQTTENNRNLDGLTVLITGGTGSFGRHLCRVLLENYNPEVVRIYSRDELKQHEMRQQFPQQNLRFFIGDIRDGERLKRAMDGVDIVIHAAALKQVSACEYNPFEAVKTNIIGAQNVIDASLDMGVKKVIALSTDKAVNPTNLYGATKLCADKIFVHGNAYAGQKPTRFSCVRYGNVLGSRGSVVPLFLQQRKNGKITITDKRMTRFWITLDQAVSFVLKSLNLMVGGEIFVPVIPSMAIIDLAKAIAPHAEVEVIGIRAGEKLHEVLITEEDGRNTIRFEDMFIVLPSHRWWVDRGPSQEGIKLPDNFVYSSDTNEKWVSGQQLRKMLDL